MLTRNRFEIKSRDQVEDVTYHFHRLWGLPNVSYNFVPYQEVEWKEVTNFSIWNLVSKLWVVLRNCNLIISRYFYFRLRTEKIFFMKILLTLPKFHEKTLSRPGDIKNFCPGWRMYIYTLPPLMDAVLSEERQLMKWVGILQVRISRGEFPRVSLMGGNFPGGNFPGTWGTRLFNFECFVQLTFSFHLKRTKTFAN